MSQQFYQQLPVFQDFKRVADDSIFSSFPVDWSLILTDIPGSTKAIESGDYKQINVLGASSIAAALNICGDLEVPFQFAGDGALLAVPNQLRDSVLKALQMARWVAKYRFDSDLRIGCFSLEDVKVAKFRLSNEASLAMLSGAGLAKAEKKLKELELQGEFYRQFPPIEPTDETFFGLECRWNPLRPRREVILTLIVKSNSRKVDDEVLQFIESEFGFVNVRPVSEVGINLAWPPRDLWHEVRVKSAHKGLLAQIWMGIKILAMSRLGAFLFKRKIRLGAFDASRYFAELIENSDYRKFDNYLRMVLDLSTYQNHQLRQYLDERQKKGDLVFGTHESSEALMTCLVFSWQRHIHFIDGGGGGYAMAARQLKAQIKS